VTTLYGVLLAGALYVPVPEAGLYVVGVLGVVVTFAVVHGVVAGLVGVVVHDVVTGLRVVQEVVVFLGVDVVQLG